MNTEQPTDRFDLTGRTALVTGSCKGLGLEIAKALLQHGARVAVHGRDTGQARDVATVLGPNARGVAFDVADAVWRERGLAAIAQELGAIDILVNNAGVRDRRPLGELSAADIKSVFEVNLFSAIELCRGVLPAMCASGYGRIINVSSIAGHLVRDDDFAYPVSKQALEAMTRVLAAEYGRYGVTCNCIAPATIATEFNRQFLASEDNTARIRARNPVGRSGKPDEVSGAVVFLASRSASYVNGQTLRIDGGFSISL